MTAIPPPTPASLHRALLTLLGVVVGPILLVWGPLPWYVHLSVGAACGAAFDVLWSRRIRRSYQMEPEQFVQVRSGHADLKANLFCSHVLGWSVFWPGLVVLETMKVPFPSLRNCYD